MHFIFLSVRLGVHGDALEIFPAGAGEPGPDAAVDDPPGESLASSRLEHKEGGPHHLPRPGEASEASLGAVPPEPLPLDLRWRLAALGYQAAPLKPGEVGKDGPLSDCEACLGVSTCIAGECVGCDGHGNFKNKGKGKGKDKGRRRRL